jgi:hypothetical protein
MHRSFTAALLGLASVFLIGCGDKPAQPTEYKGKGAGHGHEHEHDRGKEMLEDVALPGGKRCHAALTAHISAKGEHALEVSFETFEEDPNPVTLPENTKLALRVDRGMETFTLELEPGPKDERKTDPAGQCSRFEAPAKWLKPDDKLTVTLTFAGSDKKTVWTDFDVKKYSHAGD